MPKRELQIRKDKLSDCKSERAGCKRGRLHQLGNPKDRAYLIF